MLGPPRPVKKDLKSAEKRLLRSSQMAQWGNPLCPPLGNRLSSAAHAISFSCRSSESFAISSASAGLSRTVPSRSAFWRPHQ